VPRQEPAPLFPEDGETVLIEKMQEPYPGRAAGEEDILL
jgi:hypothetical protein